jgi:type IV secretion system protein VirB2
MKNQRTKTALFLVAMLAVSASNAFAGTSTGMPWEGPLTVLKNSLTGPVAMAISLIAIVVCGCMLIFGGEMSDFARKLIMICLVVALIVGASGILSTLFGTTGALLLACS